MGVTIGFEKDPINEFCSISFDNDYFYVDSELYRRFKEFMHDNMNEINAMGTKIENQRKELSSLLEKNKKLEEENQKLRDINNKNFWPNGKAPVVDFPVLQYDSIPSWFDLTFTNFRYDSRRTLNLPGKIAIEGVSDDHKKIDAFVEHGDMFSGIFSICRMSDIKDLIDKYNALVVDNRHLELEKASIRDSLKLVNANLKYVRKRAEEAKDEYEKMKEVLKRWHDATGCDNFDQAKKKIEKLRNEASCIPFGCELDNKLLKDKNKDLQNQIKKRDEEIENMAKEIQELKDGIDAHGSLLLSRAERLDKLHNHNMIWGGPGYHTLTVGGQLYTAGGYLEHKGYKCFVDAVANLEADIALLKDREIQCAKGTYTVFIHPNHMNALQIDVKHDRYQAETRLIEECSELIQALAKRKRAYSPEVNYIGSHELMELAHVIISAIVYCRYWGISNELLQKAVQVKYPEPYED